MKIIFSTKESDINATTVAVDLEKSVFQLVVADENRRVVETRRLTRIELERWFSNRGVSLVIMEACREFGIAIPTAARTSIEAISRVLAEPATAVPDLIRAQPSCWWQKSACWKRALPSWSGNWQP